MNTSFTPVSALFGGALIGLSASALLLFQGRIAGISGILGNLPSAKPSDRAWRVWFILGLVWGGFCIRQFYPEATTFEVGTSIPGLIIAGILVGYGTLLGSGCTSGHGVCGLARRSPRSLVATVSFMLAGFLTVYLVRHFIQG